jgi:hypothetical protein
LIMLSWPAASCAKALADKPMLRIEKATTRRDTFIARGMGRSFQEGFTRVDAAIPLRVVTFAAGADAVDQTILGVAP